MSLIELKDLSKNYGHVRALDRLNLNLDGGRIVGLAGPNGSGKTTLLRILGAFDAAYSGEVRIDGHKPGLETRSIVSYLPDKTALSDWMTANQAIAIYKNFFADFDEGRAREMLDFFKLEGSQKLSQMSKGMREKVQIMLVMSRDAKIYLLDEPISGVDPASRKTILRGIISQASENSLVLLSTHLIQDIEPIVDEIVFLDYGRVVLHEQADKMRAERGQSLNEAFEEIFA
ncbi:MAG: ABC transporter ATP-binding protein [Eubacteriales bacterium]|nr:ABC transporter ATP-binding protein [Eubacteriales bacterium]MDD4324118.1 ABC transporter ATP-binding protein [Eubacteriales bacterium]MDD4541455.1 ABC transporter ATP-binding protein [Eubacteriales bacterium]